MTTPAHIEQYLLARADWVPSRELAARFGYRDDRVFRTAGGRPGICSDFAISGDRGLKHVACATRTEWLTFKHRLRRHGISELVRVRNLDRVRANVTRTIKRPAIEFERDTGQAVLFPQTHSRPQRPCVAGAACTTKGAQAS